ncbi:aspartic peptidase domain-containing protein [Mycena albidolilacea]|uniref:Aspartic peptidase domain-containing protein n=1 Tax=Mycena albidolilacea TaxID=1033008 RepID=A0AAD6ZHH1_9AGAR|nr:aspartic peptidase domain-containing protein [Mycena albidolilacea]
MRSVAFSLLSLLLFSYESSAVKLSIQRPAVSRQRTALRGPKAATDVNNNLINKNNERYTANITIEGRVVNVALDTGSTDLWVKPPEGLPSFNDTKLNATLRYGDGTDFVAGDIGVGKFELGTEYSIPFQAFLNVQEAAAAEDPDFDDGIFGLWGLGFNTPGSSGVNDAVQEAFGSTATWGQSVLANIFAANPTGDDYIGISLSRGGDTGGTADASLTISEYDSDYQAVANSPKIPQNPVNSGAWTVTLDGLSIGGKKISWPSTMKEAPAGKNIVHLDTGTTNIMMPAAQVAAIYSAIPGAVLSPDSYIPQTKFSTTYDVWVVPCNATPQVVASFGGQDFPIHPLDVTDMQVVTSPDGLRNFTVCIGTFTDVGTIVDGASDALFGDSFMRNAYSVFNFGTGGTTKGTPFVQLLSQTDATKAGADLTTVRAALMANMPPELAPVDIVRIFNGTESASGKGSSSTGSGGKGGSGGSTGSTGAALSMTPSLSLAGAILLLAVISF